MIKWDGRMQNNQSVQLLKAAIPFFDVPIGETIDFEGLFRAIRPFVGGREGKLIDLLLQFFEMQHMMSMMQWMKAMQSQTENTSDMMEMLRASLTPEQQDTVDMVTSMMSMMQAAEEEPAAPEEEAGKAERDESVDL